MIMPDWTKAPDEATHFVVSRIAGIPSGWYRADGNKMRDIAAEGEYRFRLDDVKAGHSRLHIYEHSKPWGDKGLPPVGTVCEFAGGEDCPHDPWDKDLRVGDQVTIIAHFDGGNGDQLAAFTFPTKNQNRGAFNVEQGRWGCFRPIRTPEQIEAEEREKAAEAIVELMKSTRFGLESTDVSPKEIARAYAEAIYDAGYRKQKDA